MSQQSQFFYYSAQLWKKLSQRDDISLLFPDSWCYYFICVKVPCLRAVFGKFCGFFHRPAATSSDPPQIRRAWKSLRISLRARIVRGRIKNGEESRPNKSDQKSGHPGEGYRTIGKSHWTARLNRRLRNRSINHSMSLSAPMEMRDRSKEKKNSAEMTGCE